jgi:hypothetical protein
VLPELSKNEEIAAKSRRTFDPYRLLPQWGKLKYTEPIGKLSTVDNDFCEKYSTASRSCVREVVNLRQGRVFAGGGRGNAYSGIIAEMAGVRQGKTRGIPADDGNFEDFTCTRAVTSAG